jgi:hypothetical protein
MLMIGDTRETVWWSPSSLQRMSTCGYSYYLHYIVKHEGRSHAAARFGGEVVHRIIEQAYHGMTFEESFKSIWSKVCSPIWTDLCAWLEMDRAYQRVRGGRRTETKDALAWKREHPLYTELEDRILAYQHASLGHLRWSERTSLLDYFRRSAILTEVPRERILLSHPWLVEGRWLVGASEDEDLLASDLVVAEAEVKEEEEKSHEAKLLTGRIGSVRVRGIPDVVAQGEDKELVVADYKTIARPLTRQQIAVNIQLLIYVELLRQNGILLPGQPARIGHIYLSDAGVSQVWADASFRERYLPLLAQQLEQAERRRAEADFVPIAGLHPSFLDPCPTCDMAHVCDAAPVAAMALA